MSYQNDLLHRAEAALLNPRSTKLLDLDNFYLKPRRKLHCSFYSFKMPTVDLMMLRGCGGPSCWGSTLLAVKFKFCCATSGKNIWLTKPFCLGQWGKGKSLNICFLSRSLGKKQHCPTVNFFWLCKKDQRFLCNGLCFWPLFKVPVNSDVSSTQSIRPFIPFTVGT